MHFGLFVALRHHPSIFILARRLEKAAIRGGQAEVLAAADVIVERLVDIRFGSVLGGE